MSYRIEASGGKIAYLDKDGQAHVHTWNPGTRDHRWIKLGNPPNVKFTDITLGNGEVWGLTASGAIYQHNWASKTWRKDPKGKLASISGDQSGNVWGVNSSGKVFQLSKRADGKVRLGTWKEKETPARTANWLYRVKDKDTLFKIVRAQYDKDGAAATRIVNQIAALNPGKVRGANKTIRKGDILTMPPK